MATHTIADSKKFVYFTEGSVSGNSITYTNDREICKVAVTRIEETPVNALIDIQIPVPRGRWTTKAPSTWALDLKRWKRVFTITGYLIDEADWGDGTAQTRETKRDYLRYLAGLDTTNMRGGTVTMLWGTSGTDRQSFTGCISKFMIRDTAELDAQATNKFFVMITFVEGVNR